jgi:hypothetical protein
MARRPGRCWKNSPARLPDRYASDDIDPYCVMAGLVLIRAIIRHPYTAPLRFSEKPGRGLHPPARWRLWHAHISFPGRDAATRPALLPNRSRLADFGRPKSVGPVKRVRSGRRAQAASGRRSVPRTPTRSVGCGSADEGWPLARCLWPPSSCPAGRPFSRKGRRGCARGDRVIPNEKCACHSRQRAGGWRGGAALPRGKGAI